MLRFELARLIFIKDIERCPYPLFSEEAGKWAKKRDKEELLIALERYVFMLDYLKKTNQYVR